MSYILSGFIHKNRKEVLKKFDRFALAGLAKIHLVIDFDRTLTIGRNKSNEDITTWQALKEHLPHTAFNRYYELFNKYRPLEIEGKLNIQGAETWWKEVLSLFAERRINLVEVEKDFLIKVSIRPQAKELFDFCKKQNIPTVILSAGIKDVIDLWAKTYLVNPTLVLSTKLNINSKGDIVGWEENSLIHTLNKEEKGHAELKKVRQKRPYVILVGDSIEDAGMVKGVENVLRIRINDPRGDARMDRDMFVRKTFEKYDLMIENGKFSPILRLLQIFMENKEQGRRVV